MKRIWSWIKKYRDMLMNMGKAWLVLTITEKLIMGIVIMSLPRNLSLAERVGKGYLVSKVVTGPVDIVVYSWIAYKKWHSRKKPVAGGEVSSS